MKIIVNWSFFFSVEWNRKIKNAKIKMLRFGAQIAKISNRRKYPLYGNISIFHVLLCHSNKPCRDVSHDKYRSVINSWLEDYGLSSYQKSRLYNAF